MIIALAIAILLAFTDVAIAAEGAPSSPAPMADVARRIRVPDVQKRRAAGEKIIFLDTRSDADATMIKGAKHVPASDLEAWAKEVPRDALIVTYCA